MTDTDWNDRLAAFPQRSFFHSAEWARVLADTYGFTPVYFTAIRKDRLVSLLPVMEVNSWLTGRRGISLPFTDRCEPLGLSEESISDLFEAALRHGRRRGWRYLECRGNMAGAPSFRNASPALSFLGHRLSIFADTQFLFSKFDSSVRRAIRKAEKADLTVEIARTQDAVRDYYALHCLTRKHHGLPPQPLGFFLNIHKWILSQDMGMVISARHNRRTVASAVYFHAGTEAIYKYGASDPAFLELRGNNLVMWEAIKWCAANGIKTLDFGRSSFANEGLRRYKLGWGTEESQIHYFKYDLRSSGFVKDKDEAHGWHNRVFRALPVSLSRAIGAGLYRHVA